MKFKVYNQNGKVKITKICSDNSERPMFSDLSDGEVAEIEVGVPNVYTKSHKKKISNVTESDEALDEDRHKEGQ